MSHKNARHFHGLYPHEIDLIIQFRAARKGRKKFYLTPAHASPDATIEFRVTMEEFAAICLLRASRVCEVKRAFDDEVQAMRAAVRDMANCLTRAPKLYCYQCPFCGKWHLTRRPL